jgi:hypothetical protein
MGIGIVLQQSTSFKKSIIEKGLTFNIQNKICWDAEFHFEAYRLGAKFLNVPFDLGRFRAQPEAITQSKGYSERLQAEHERLLLETFPWLLVKTRSIPSFFFRALKKFKNLILHSKKTEASTTNLLR